MSTAEVPRFHERSAGTLFRTPPVVVVETPWLPPITPDMRPEDYDLPTQDDLPGEDGAMQNAFDHPQSALLKDSLLPTLNTLHPDGLFCVVHDTAFYVRTDERRRSTGIVPDWAYVPGLSMLREDGSPRRSFLAWEGDITPVVALEYLSFTGGGERDATPESGKYWWYERHLKPKHYGIFDVDGGQLEVYRHTGVGFERMDPDASGRYHVEPLGLDLGVWRGNFAGMDTWWMRWYLPDGTLLPTDGERADALRARADDFRAKADTLAAKLRELGVDPDAL